MRIIQLNSANSKPHWFNRYSKLSNFRKTEYTILYYETTIQLFQFLYQWLHLAKKSHHNLRYSNFYCYLCLKTSDNESNSQQSAEIDTVAKSLPHFLPLS